MTQQPSGECLPDRPALEGEPLEGWKVYALMLRDEVVGLKRAMLKDKDRLAVLESKLSVARMALRAIACSAPCVDGHESFNSPGLPCDQRIADKALAEIDKET